MLIFQFVIKIYDMHVHYPHVLQMVSFMKLSYNHYDILETAFSGRKEQPRGIKIKEVMGDLEAGDMS